MMDVTTLQIACDADGGSTVTTWVKCRALDDVDDVIAWLGLARQVMADWQEVRAARQQPAPAKKQTNITAIKKSEEP